MTIHRPLAKKVSSLVARLGVILTRLLTLSIAHSPFSWATPRLAILTKGYSS